MVHTFWDLTGMWVDIETEWNLKEMLQILGGYFGSVDIETEWNLKTTTRGES